jgi:hypothetical protein
MDSNIIAECYVDTLLIETIVPPVRGYNHQHSCTKVLSTMKNKLSDEFAVGIIDDDKSVPKDLLVFSFVKKYNNALALYKHQSKPHYVIKIIPAVEKFIFNTAQQCNVSLADYNLPTDLKKFTAITKHVISKNNPDLKKLLHVLIQNDADNFRKLSQWLKHLTQNPYNPQMDVI